MSDKPLFVVFEGLDGSGTSTQASMLTSYLSQNRTKKSHSTSEPSSGPVGQMIRTAMSGRLKLNSDKDRFDRQMAYLFAADRHDHLYNDTNGVMKLLADGFSVVSTRYYFSSFAYHCNNDEDFEIIESLNCRFPKPDLTVFIDVPLEVSLNRLQTRSNLDAYENSEKLRKVKTNYENYFAGYSGELLRIDGTDTPQALHEKIRNKVNQF